MVNKQAKKEIVRLGILITLVIYLGCIMRGVIDTEETITIKADAPVAASTPTPIPTATPIPADKDMEALIKEIFGEHSDKAFLLLQGRGDGTCAENRTLDPNATNWNGNGTTDFGLFQLNDHWNGFKQMKRNDQFLFDPEINARIAWRLFEDDDYSFKLWTCGKVYGI